MNYYRISKYDPRYRVNGIYQKDEWTSICDIGNIYNGLKFSKNEYYQTEQNYVDFVFDIIRAQGEHGLKITYLESNERLPFEKGQVLNAEKIDCFIRACLREECWGQILSKTFAFENGYDYYIHIGCDLDYDTIVRISREHKLFVEKWEDIVDANNCDD